ncbi:hypothetical protein K2X92_05210 [Candidatus Gracilibacteria bacterium]|nr:hypothetical protein [Candidatus Gracilibacteria bacterium]
MTKTGILTSQENIDAAPEITKDQGSSIISRTHAALAMAVLAIGLSQNIKAQEVQKETTPLVTATAEKTVKKEIPGAVVTITLRTPEKKEEAKQLTKDGREYSKLIEADVDALSDDEFDAYQKWKTADKLAKLAAATAQLNSNKTEVAQLDGQLKTEKAEVAQLDGQLKTEKAEVAQLKIQLEKDRLELGLKASQSIKPLLAQYQAGEKPVISEDLRNTLIQIAEGKLPPPDMRTLAQELVKYFA